MSFTYLPAEQSHWRESNQMGVLNTDLAKQTDAAQLGCRLWRLRPGEASTRHRHRSQEELYILLEGEGRIRIGSERLELSPMDAVRIEPAATRQLFNDTPEDALWLVVGAPREAANTLEMSESDLAWHYPDGPKALPPELEADER